MNTRKNEENNGENTGKLFRCTGLDQFKKVLRGETVLDKTQLDFDTLLFFSKKENRGNIVGAEIPGNVALARYILIKFFPKDIKKEDLFCWSDEVNEQTISVTLFEGNGLTIDEIFETCTLLFIREMSRRLFKKRFGVKFKRPCKKVKEIVKLFKKI